MECGGLISIKMSNSKSPVIPHHHIPVNKTITNQNLHLINKHSAHRFTRYSHQSSESLAHFDNPFPSECNRPAANDCTIWEARRTFPGSIKPKDPSSDIGENCNRSSCAFFHPCCTGTSSRISN